MLTLHQVPFLPEVAIANFESFLIVIPTQKILLRRQVMPGLPNFKRMYSDSGWFFGTDADQVTGMVRNLQLTSLFPEQSPFKVSKRLSPGLPVSFELISYKILPRAIAGLALFQYQLQNEVVQFPSVFRQLKPNFVRIYPFQSVHDLPNLLSRYIQGESTVYSGKQLYSMEKNH